MSRKPESEYSAGECKFAERVKALKAGKPNAYVYRKSIAVTKDGDFIIGLSYDISLERYSCSAIEHDGIRYNNPCRWDKWGKSLDCDISDLLMGSVHEGVRLI